jgi:hypothetical protein
LPCARVNALGGSSGASVTKLTIFNKQDAPPEPMPFFELEYDLTNAKIYHAEEYRFCHAALQAEVFVFYFIAI